MKVPRDVRGAALLAALRRMGYEKVPQGVDRAGLQGQIHAFLVAEQILDAQQEAADMNSSITVRGIDPRDKFWLEREAREVGVSMEELARRLIHEKRTNTENRPKPSEAFARHFGEEHGIELSPLPRCGSRPPPG